MLLLAGAVLNAAERSERYPLNGQSGMRLEASRASVMVRSGDVQWIELRVVTVGWKISATEVSVVESHDAHTINFGVRVPAEFFGVGRRGVQVDLIVPRKLNVAIRTGEGRIMADGLSGDIRLSTGHGRIDAQRLSGLLESFSSDGALQVAGRFDRLSLKTNDGPVVLKIADGSKMTGPWSIQTGGGSIQIEAGEKFSADLDAQTGDGSVTVDLPLAVSRQRGEASLRGKLNGGGEKLVVRSRDGSIHIGRPML
jgi:DUF4097 and DUF4098 domain-containing protein YvlB